MEQANAPESSRKIGGAVAITLASIALVLAGLSILSVRASLQEQSTISTSLQALIKNNDSLTKAVESLASSASTPPVASTTSKPSPSKPTIRVVREAVEVSAESLEKELEEVAATLKMQYPKSAEALHVVALMKAQTRKYTEAQNLWQDCISLSPKQESFHVNLASVAIKQGDFDLAVETLSKAQLQGLESIDLVYHLALAQSKLGKHDQVIAIAERALAKNAAAPSMWTLLGLSLLETDQLERAETSLRKALELGDESPGVLIGLGNTCRRLGKREESATFLKRYAEAKKDTLTGMDRYEALTKKDIQQTATTVYTEAAMVFFRNKDNMQTEHLLSRCVAIAPTSIPHLLALADYYFQTKMLAEERAVRERIIELNPGAFNHYLNLAKVSAQLGDLESAEATLKMATTLFPAAAEPYSALSQFNGEAGKLDKARWYAQRSLERQPSAEGFRYLASICNRLQDRLGEADALKCAQQMESPR